PTRENDADLSWEDFRMTLKLYMHPVSTVSRPVSLFVAEKNLPVEMQVVDLMKGEHMGPDYSSKNPSKQVPLLEEGDWRIPESSAILKYLAARFDCPEYPKDLKQRAQVDAAMDWTNTMLYRDFGYGLLYPQIFPHHKRPTDEQHKGTIAWGKTKCQGALAILDKDWIGKNDYMVNNQISIADYFAVCIITAGGPNRCRLNHQPHRKLRDGRDATM